VRGAHDVQVESEVLRRLVSVVYCLVQVVDVVSQAVQVARQGAHGRQCRSLRLEQAPHLEQLELHRAIDRVAEAVRAQEQVGPQRAHEGAAARPDLDHFECGQLAHRLAHRGSTDRELLDQLFAKRREARIEGARTRLASKRTLRSKVAELTRILDEDGYLASWEQVAPGVFRIVEHNCAIWAVAERYGQACTSELEFIRTVLDGADVERVQHMVAGARRCAYEVTARGR
jgi:predicted ArsR family transcriptional regulator